MEYFMLRPAALAARPDAASEAGVVFRDRAAHRASQDGEFRSIRSCCLFYARRRIEFEAGMVLDLLQRASRVHARKAETARLRLPQEQCLAGEQRLRPAAPRHLRRTPARRADEI